MNKKSSGLFYVAPLLAVFLIAVMVSCGQGKDSSEVTDKDTPTENESKPNEEQIRNFLYDTEGNYGWQTTSDDITFSFFQDGRLHIQGLDGEATMWEGTWTLKGDQLTMDRKDLGKTETLTVERDGEKLLLGDKTYTRYSPVQ